MAEARRAAVGLAMFLPAAASKVCFAPGSKTAKSLEQEPNIIIPLGEPATTENVTTNFASEILCSYCLEYSPYFYLLGITCKQNFLKYLLLTVITTKF